jgi:RNA polymerase sigma-70 factor, ECF subfamily
LQRKPVAPFTPLARAVKASSDARAYAHGDVADELLMVRYQRGDRAAFASLVRRHQRGVYNFVLRQSQNPMLADELSQQIFLRAVQRSGEFKQEIRFRTWLYTIARTLVQEELQKEDAARTAQPAPASEPSPRVASEGDQVMGLRARQRSDRASSAPVASLIVDAVVTLPRDQREVLLLRELGNLSFKEIAEVTGASETSVKARTRQALERVQQVLSDFDEYARELK